jgi:hypothetical protein
MNSPINDNWSMFIKGSVTFTMVKMFDFTQNLVNLDALWCNAWIFLHYSSTTRVKLAFLCLP